MYAGAPGEDHVFQVFLSRSEFHRVRVVASHALRGRRQIFVARFTHDAYVRR